MCEREREKERERERERERLRQAKVRGWIGGHHPKSA